jgi:hypothetical protein
MMIVVAVVAVLTAAGMYLGPELAFIVGTFAVADLAVALLIGRLEGFNTRGTLVITATALFWALQYLWWGNPAAVTLAMSIFCMATVPVWYVPPGGSLWLKLLFCQMLWGVLTMMAATMVLFVVFGILIK